MHSGIHLLINTALDYTDTGKLESRTTTSFFVVVRSGMPGMPGMLMWLVAYQLMPGMLAYAGL